MLCEKDTTSRLHTLFAKGDAVSRDYEVWNRELAGHRFRRKFPLAKWRSHLAWCSYFSL